MRRNIFIHKQIRLRFVRPGWHQTGPRGPEVGPAGFRADDLLLFDESRKPAIAASSRLLISAALAEPRPSDCSSFDVNNSRSKRWASASRSAATSSAVTSSAEIVFHDSIRVSLPSSLASNPQRLPPVLSQRHWSAFPLKFESMSR